MAFRVGVLDQICEHMTSVLNSWGVESLHAEAARYETRNEFKKGSPGAYDSARRVGILDEVCLHMMAVKRPWGFITLKEEAARYETRSDFQKGSGGAYNAARRLGIMDDLFPVDKEVKDK